MKKFRLHRLLAFVLALCFLVGGAVTTAAATGDSVTDESLADLKEQLNAMSYEDYKAKYLDVLGRGESAIVIDADADYDPAQTTASVSVLTEMDALSTPGTGSVTWKVNVPAAAKYSIVIEYWPTEAKSTSIERILKINGSIPFAEARYVTLPKIWGSAYPMAKVSEKGLSVDALYDEAIQAGFSADSLRKNAEENCLEVQIPRVWTDKTSAFTARHTVRFFESDIDNNELRPTTVQLPEWTTYELRDIDGFYAETFEFAFGAGEQTLTLEAVNEPMAIRSISLVPHEDLAAYTDYAARYAGTAAGQDTVRIQSEYTDRTSTQTVYPIEDRTEAATEPSDTSRTVLNTIGGEKWQTAGQWVRYNFTVGTGGMYNIAARYRQNVLDGMYVCRSLYIYSEGLAKGAPGYYDGIPFKEASEFRFNYGSKWQTTVLNNGAADERGNLFNYDFYFEAGVTYTVQLEVTVGSMGDIVRRVEKTLTAINADYLAILKLTGASPDEYRDYGFSRIMPETLVDMIIQSRELNKIAEELVEITGEKSSNVATLERVAWLLERMGSNEDQIAKYLKQLKSYIGSIGTWLGDAKTQPLQLDYLVVQPAGTGAPRAEAGFFTSLAHEFKSFIMSFFRNYNRMGATAEDKKGEHVVEVWIATGRDQAQVLRNLINNDFSRVPSVAESGTTVNLQLIAGGALLPSVLAGTGPDVYIGLGEDSVINYAIRGALLPIENMEGFADLALAYQVDEKFHTKYDADGNPLINPNAQYNNAAMLVLGIEDASGDFHYYGLPETQGFQMMFVRTDILANLNIDIPKTWDDILAASTILQANNMQVGMHTDYKVFLYQMGGSLFADDGMRINLDSDMGLTSFDKMCSYFTEHSFPYSYDFVNRFRTGEMPIGFASYTATYNHLTVFATEIKGLWKFYPLPGLVQTDKEGNTLYDGEGNPVINNVAVSTVTAIVMMQGCKNKEGSWEFMKWHSGADCQVKYSNEMVAIIGPSAKHSTANINALREMPWTSEEYTQIQYQFNNLASIPNYPGSYIIGRYTSFAFLAAYNKGANPVTELQKYISTINKEITRKREEFGLETLELGQTLAQKRLAQVKETFDSETRRMASDKLEAAAAAVKHLNDAFKYLDNTNPSPCLPSLVSARDGFAAVDAEAFSATIAAIDNAVTVISKY